MSACVFIIFPLLLLNLETTSANQLVVVGRDDNSVISKCFDNERDALLHFKAPLQDPYDNGCLASWIAEQHDCCIWKGVTCNNQTSRVIGLDLASCRLGGEISHSLLNLTYLNHLDLYYNYFHGTIPTFIGSLTQLIYLDLSFNSFYGTIPPEFGNLTNLESLSLRSVGRCRVENLEWLSHLPHLEELVMDRISLAKANYWVDTILSLRKLSFLSLGGCELSRVMYPYSSVLNSTLSIDVLDLGNNSLTSSMYRWLFPLTSGKLREFYLSYNMLDGIPNYLGNLCNLTSLYIGDNYAVVNLPNFLSNLSGCTSLTLEEFYAPRGQFIGSLSDEIQNFASLKYLYLPQNQLNGNISDKMWELPKLETLDLSFNNLRVPSIDHMPSLSYVTDIFLRSCKVGPRFPKWILTFTNLTALDLSGTRISDTIPVDFWDTWPSQLQYLNLSSNNISAKVPDLSSNFANLSVIDLSSNCFYGPILKVPSSLAWLNLSRNKFYGGISFLCQIVDGLLEILDLSHNFLSGQLPNCLWHFKDLKVLNLGHNNLFGRLPPSIGSLVELEVFYLYNNNFSEELPLSLMNCTSLISLNLGDNKFSGNVPAWIGEKLSRLYVLILRSNNFFGTIPLQSCQLENLHILDLSMNNLHGTIPSCLSNLMSMVQQGFLQPVQYYRIVRHDGYEIQRYVDHALIGWQGDEREFFKNLRLLKSIDLSSNNLTGQIPNEIANLYDLIALNLSKNTLIGEIPWKIGAMKKLLTLDLSRNKLSGRIPSSMSDMSLLNYLDVSFNNFSGRIPSSTQLQSFQPSRYDGNTQLCGPPLTKKCPGDEESVIINKHEGNEEDIHELERWFYIGGGTGFVTGFWIVCGVLLVHRRGRHVFFQFYDNLKDWIYVKVVVFIANL